MALPAVGAITRAKPHSLTFRLPRAAGSAAYPSEPTSFLGVGFFMRPHFSPATEKTFIPRAERQRCNCVGLTLREQELGDVRS